MNKTLQMVFTNAAGQPVTISVADPRDNLTQGEVAAAMAAIIAHDVFLSLGGALVDSLGARVVSRGVQTVFGN
ncbi:MAG: DUF2922 domain-containing protein [Peptococcaceae bacterium]|nr:DUF2922 domain-containing protein [Peptococcaceae bacterium]MBT9135989.1 hypothetical protein [Bacillota bacterium]